MLYRLGTEIMLYRLGTDCNRLGTDTGAKTGWSRH